MFYLSKMQGPQECCLRSGSTEADSEMNIHVRGRERSVLPQQLRTYNREFLYYITGEKSSERKKRGKERKKKSKIERQNGGRIKLYLGGLCVPHWVIISSVKYEGDIAVPAK